MAGRWYYRQGQIEAGPVSLSELVALAQAGQLAATHWVREGESNPWQPAGKTPELRLGFESVAAPLKPHLSGAMPVLPRAVAAAPAPLRAPAVKAAPPPLRTTHSSPPTATPPIAAPPLPRPAPVRAVVAAAPVAAVATQSAEHGSSILQQRHRKQSPIGLIVGLGLGAVGLVVVLGVVIFGGLLKTGDEASKTIAVQDTSETKVGEKPAASGDTLESQRAAAVNAITKWLDADKTTGGARDIVSFKVERAAYGAGETGQVIVELSLTNKSASPLKYEGWNSAGKHGAWLVDKDNDFVAAAKGAADMQMIPVGKTIIEVITFETGKQNFTELRLVLPKSAFSQSRHWGYIIPGKMLQGETKPVTSIATTGKPSGESIDKPNDVPAIIANSGDEPAPGISAVKPTPAPVDNGEPTEDIRDLIRQSVKGAGDKAEMKKE